MLQYYNGLTLKTQFIPTKYLPSISLCFLSIHIWTPVLPITFTLIFKFSLHYDFFLIILIKKTRGRPSVATHGSSTQVYQYHSLCHNMKRLSVCMVTAIAKHDFQMPIRDLKSTVNFSILQELKYNKHDNFHHTSHAQTPTIPELWSTFVEVVTYALNERN